MNQNDHDLLIVIAEGQKDIKADVKTMSETLATLVKQQNDQDNRLSNLTATVTGLKLERDADRKDISDLKADHTRWKLYMKVALVLMTPMYLVILALLIEAGKRWLFS